MTLETATSERVSAADLDVLPHGTRYHGNIQLLEEPLIAFFCSSRCPGDLILKTYDLARSMRDAGVAVIGGFQTPMETECLRLLLRGNQPVVVCLARSIGKMRLPRDWRGPLKQGMLLVLPSFSLKFRRATSESSDQRSELASFAGQVFIAHAAPGSKTESFTRKMAHTGKSLLTLESPANKNLEEMGSRTVRPGMIPPYQMEITSHGA